MEKEYLEEEEKQKNEKRKKGRENEREFRCPVGNNLFMSLFFL